MTRSASTRSGYRYDAFLNSKLPLTVSLFPITVFSHKQCGMKTVISGIAGYIQTFTTVTDSTLSHAVNNRPFLPLRCPVSVQDTAIFFDFIAMQNVGPFRACCAFRWRKVFSASSSPPAALNCSQSAMYGVYECHKLPVGLL